MVADIEEEDIDHKIPRMSYLSSGNSEYRDKIQRNACHFFNAMETRNDNRKELLSNPKVMQAFRVPQGMERIMGSKSL